MDSTLRPGLLQKQTPVANTTTVANGWSSPSTNPPRERVARSSLETTTRTKAVARRKEEHAWEEETELPVTTRTLIRSQFRALSPSSVDSKSARSFRVRPQVVSLRASCFPIFFPMITLFVSLFFPNSVLASELCFADSERKGSLGRRGVQKPAPSFRVASVQS